MALIWQAIRAAYRWLTQPGSWKAILVGCALISVAFGVGKVLTLRSDNAALKTAVIASEQRAASAEASVKLLTKANEANTRAIASRNEMLEIISQQTEKERAASLEVLKANAAWSDAPIPDAVLERLRKAGSSHRVSSGTASR